MLVFVIERSLLFLIENAVNLMFSCLGPNVTAQKIETYISAKIDDDRLEVVKVKMLGEGTASALVKGMVMMILH